MTTAATLLKAASFTNQFRRLLGSAMDSLSNKYFVDGKFVELKSTFPVYNPYNGQLVGNAADCDKSHAEEAVKAATKAFSSWKNTTAKVRLCLMMVLIVFVTITVFITCNSRVLSEVLAIVRIC